ncbi:MAG: cytochrome c [Deltaproteobacteria bacterium]|nr:cytochrome c [Deltaproteobacteria bacterium]
MIVVRFSLFLFLPVFLFGCLRSERMETIYAERCLGCHGTSGKGDGPIAVSLPVGIPDFRETVRAKNVFQIRKVIKEGKGIMPAYSPALTNPEVQDMVRMVRVVSQQGREIAWWEKFEPLVWAHCSVPWEFVLGYDQPPQEKGP